MKNYYEILQLSEGASREEIFRAYRKLAKQNHPDVSKSPLAHEKFCEISEAYDFLMNHWPRHVADYTGRGGNEQKYREHQETEAYEEFRRESQERAKRQARMKYERFQKQHEAFQESGLNDIALLFTIFMRFLSVFLFLFLFFIPVLLAIFVHWSLIFVLFFMWPFAGGLGWYYHDNRKHYFIPGKFYYSFNRIRHLFTDKHDTTQPCYYSHGKMADSRPYKLDLLKLKDIKLKSGGFRQHNVNYVNKSVSVLVPRSHKAFTLHCVNILIKLFSITGCLIFLNISSIIWRIIIGILLGGFLSRLNLTLFQTKSNTTYLYSPGLIFRIILWITGISLASRFYTSPFDIYTTDFIQFVIVAIIVFDSFIMQLLSLVLGKHSSQPIISQNPETNGKFKEGYTVYNDVPVISFIYPIFKWIFG